MNLKSYYKNNTCEAGCDEAGRGCLAGPVVAAAVILNPVRPILRLNDSKQLNEQQRDALRPEIEEKALSFAVQFIGPGEIDLINILQASLRAMLLSVSQLSCLPALVLVDGNKTIPHLEIPQVAIIKGDALYQSIAAASILAKTYRDEFMNTIHHEFPWYNWKKNKGYPTAEHRSAILMHGFTQHHRMTFKIKNPNPTINLFS
ncbi:MAG: ribonuclease HII [Saprospiraceae bacterium]|nr:ribonuclease HII [Saprospiraceae bacterium]MCI1266597.1 ribonuclease HII [Saprospiraceae bacterium]